MLCCDDDAEHCLCGCFHVMTGTTMIAIFKIIQQVLYLFAAIAALFYNETEVSAMSGHIVFTVIAIVVTTLLYLGVKHSNPKRMLPYMVYQGFALLLCAVSLCVFVILLIFPYDLDAYLSKLFDKPILHARMIVAIVTAVVGLYTAFECWLFSTVRSCYSYLMAEEDESLVPLIGY